MQPKGKWFHIRNDSQEMPHGDDYKQFLKNSLNKAELIRLFNKSRQLEVPCLHVDYPLMITL